MNTAKSNARGWIKLILLAIFTLAAFIPQDMLAASDDDLVGTWTLSGMHPSGAFVSSTFVFRGDKNGSFNMYVNGNLANSSSFVWRVDGDTLCVDEASGDRNCMTVSFVTSSSLGLKTPSGKQSVYSRVGYQVPFGGTRACCKTDCKCKGWDRGSNGNCKNCPHSYVMHAGPSGCTYH